MFFFDTKRKLAEINEQLNRIVEKQEALSEMIQLHGSQEKMFYERSLDKLGKLERVFEDGGSSQKEYFDQLLAKLNRMTDESTEYCSQIRHSQEECANRSEERVKASVTEKAALQMELIEKISGELQGWQGRTNQSEKEVKELLLEMDKEIRLLLLGDVMDSMDKAMK